MMISIFLAKFLGGLYLIVGVLMLVKKSVFTTALRDMARSPGLMILAGIMTLITGILLILVHNFWYAGWAIVITILAWLALIQGIVRTAFPGVAAKLMIRSADNDGAYYAATGVLVLLGLYLSYFGFM